MNIHTAVLHRLDVLDVWVKAMRTYMPQATLHVWYAGDRPTCGDVLHPMPNVGIGAAPWVVKRLPTSEYRVFIESDIIPMRPWTVDDYPATLVLLEGSPGRRWFAVTMATPDVDMWSNDFLLIPQPVITAENCPAWLPETLRPHAIAAHAKVVGNHWLHLDKMHREQGTTEEKTQLLVAVDSFFSTT